MHAIHGRISTLGALGTIALTLLLGACNHVTTGVSASADTAATASTATPAGTASGTSSSSSPASANSAITENTGMAPAATPIFIGTSTPGSSTPVVTTPVAHVATIISGSPATAVTVGASYQFQPAVQVADATAHLTFSIQGKPSWLSFSATTGVLSGTPAAGDVGTSGSISVSVNDGIATVALAAFSISVTQIATGSATLTWSAPTLNTDGSALTDLTGYVVHYGKSAAAMTQQTAIASAGTLRYVVGNLDPGTWYFAVTSVNSAKVESPLSPTVTKSI